MKKLIALGVLVATAAFSGTAFADGIGLQDQKLFEWSVQAVEEARQAQVAGPGAQPTEAVSPYREYPGVHGRQKFFDGELQKLFDWSAQAPAVAKQQIAGYQEYPGVQEQQAFFDGELQKLFDWSAQASAVTAPVAAYQTYPFAIR